MTADQRKLVRTVPSGTKGSNWIAVLFGLTLALSAHAASWVHSTAEPGDFILATPRFTAPILYSPDDFKVVELAAHDLAADIARVNGHRPILQTDAHGLHESIVLIGTLGKNPIIDALAAAGKLGDAANISSLRNSWESFLIIAVTDPLPGVPAALVIVGSDRRGTAFGVYELSQAIGVSPWYWWADVTPEKQAALYIAAGTRRFGPPSVKYRGIFINDEDWGLQPWAAKTFETEVGDIGPKTYAKLCELLLRLKANTLWLAMHACTKAFNLYPQNKIVADDYAIVMGSSHAEPMLRNNVTEWTAPHEDYNYLNNRDGVRAYWEQRVKENGRFENLYTLGMRGIHDSNMQGPKTDPERIHALEQIFADQRELLTRYVQPEIERVPQMFCAYKEVLSLYRQGLKVPDDVTILWPDDNFGYIRNFATADQRNRSGGFGVYYHLSYLGAPLSYLWLSTTPPALIWEEMTKAYAAGAQTIWIANVGDLKPAEIGTEFFLQLAWDTTRWHRNNLDDFLRTWATREFGAEHASAIARVMQRFYQLNAQRRPEHLQWWLPKESPRASALNDREVQERLAEFASLAVQVTELAGKISPSRSDAFFELVSYPVLGAKLANERFFHGENGGSSAVLALQSDRELHALTRHYNENIAGGKWRSLLALEPASGDWKSMRIAPWSPPKQTRDASPVAGPGGVISLEAEHFTHQIERAGTTWDRVPGLGRTGEGSVTIFPTTAPSIPLDKIATEAPRLDYAVTFGTSGDFSVTVYLLPVHPLAGPALRFALALDDAPPTIISLVDQDGGAAWAQGVLSNTRIAHATLHVPSPGPHTLKISMIDAGVVLDKIVVDCGGLIPSYLGPPESPTSRP